MFGDTLVLPQVGGDITLNKINQDGYTSEYLFRTSLVSYTAKIRHSKVKAKDGVMYDRHNVEVTKVTFAASPVPEYYVKMYFVMEMRPDFQDVILTDAVMDWGILTANANLTKLTGWES